MQQAAAKEFFARVEHPPFEFTCEVSGQVPTARGLGSSVTVRLGLLFALNELIDSPLDRHDLFGLCSALEGHPDNAAPAAFGGFTIARGQNVQSYRVLPRLKFILLVPDFEVVTSESRRLLPEGIRRLDAVMSAGNAAALAGAFTSRRYGKLRDCFRDGLHQPYRKKLVPFLDDVITAAGNAGALGAFLSGSGSTICALALDHTPAIADAMLEAADTPKGRIIVTQADNRGARAHRIS